MWSENVLRGPPVKVLGTGSWEMVDPLRSGASWEDVPWKGILRHRPFLFLSVPQA